MNFTNLPPLDNVDWTGRTIMLVEDNEINIKFLDIVLKKTKAKIHFAMNGKKAVEIYQQHPEIEVILMDLQMPIMDGYQAFQAIREINPDIPILAQSSFEMREEKEKCFTMGFNGYILKPIKKEILFAEVDRFFQD